MSISIKTTETTSHEPKVQGTRKDLACLLQLRLANEIASTRLMRSVLECQTTSTIFTSPHCFIFSHSCINGSKHSRLSPACALSIINMFCFFCFISIEIKVRWYLRRHIHAKFQREREQLGNVRGNTACSCANDTVEAKCLWKVLSNNTRVVKCLLGDVTKV